MLSSLKVKMASQFDVTTAEKKLIEERAKRRLALREHFLKESSDPFRHGSGEGGAVFDPAIQRFIAMRASTFDHFRPTPKTVAWGIMIAVIPLLGFGYLVKSSRERREASYRKGEVAYSDRKFKFN